MRRAWWKLLARSRRVRRRAGDELWALRALIRRALRAPRPAGPAPGRTPLPVVLAGLAIVPFALAGAVSIALLPSTESEPGPAPDRVSGAAPRDAAEELRAQQRRHRAPERRGERRRVPAPAPVPVVVPGEPAAPSPSGPAVEESPAVDPPAAERPSPETPERPGRADLEPGPLPQERERAPSEEERLLEPPTAKPAPEEPPAPPAGEPLPAQLGETDQSDVGSAPALEVPAAP